MGRIATLLPGGRTVAELMAHDDWTTAARLLARKRRDLAEAWDRERRQFLEDSASFLQVRPATTRVGRKGELAPGLAEVGVGGPPCWGVDARRWGVDGRRWGLGARPAGV